jgi:response regulator RpfG family c-di-GMP phosphodiesterase
LEISRYIHRDYRAERLEPVPQLSRSSFWKTAVAIRTPELRQPEYEDDRRTEPSRLFEAQSPAEGTEAILFGLARAVEQRDQDTWGHCERLALISVALGAAMGLDRTGLVTLYRGGYLHDIGKVGIPDSILFKRGKLNAAEWIVMRTHTARGEDLCRHMTSLQPALPIIRHHHERWDGSGYPDRLQGEQIPLLARVVHIADVYDALTSQRSYKEAFGEERALEIIQAESQRGWHDPSLTEIFVKFHDEVISRITGFSENSDAKLERKRSSLLRLNQFLAWQA